MTYLERYTLLAATGTDNDGRLVDEEQKPKTSEARLLQSLISIKEAPELVTLQRGFVIVVQEAHEMNDKDASMLVAAEAVPPPSGLRSLRPEDVKKSISLKFRLNRNVCRRPSGRS